MPRITHGDLCVNGSRVPSDCADQSAECPFDTLVNRTATRENTPSERLLAANAKLLALRSRRPLTPSNQEKAQPNRSAEPYSLPAHLGWGSRAFSQQLPQRPPSVAPEATVKRLAPISVTPAKPPQTAPHVMTHPSILTAMLRQEVAAIGRIWLLARYLDQAGRGWLHVDQLRAELTHKASPLRCVGWRRLRQILASGEGCFWTRDAFGRIFLFGTTRVAEQLDVDRLTGKPILLAPSDLTGTIATVRAHMYASFHAGRVRDDGQGMPITRTVLAELTGASERSQRTYDQQLGLTKQSNVIVVSTKANTDIQAACWQRQVLFRQNGKLLRRLPNSYGACHQTVTCRLQKRINQQLRKGLVKYGTQGNDCNSIERVFFVSGREALANVTINKDVFVRQADRAANWYTVGMFG